MKNTIFRIILTALTASLSLASCTKEMETDPGNGGTSVADGVREFTLSFTVPTKSAFGSGDDGWQHPVFSTGDVIKVSNATESEDCEVTGSGSAAKIRTTLSGTLTAVYPSTAAVLSNGTTGSITGIKVSETQDGTFASANICMAESIAEDATSITFVNKTALFKITPPSGVTQFTVTSLNAVEDGVARTGAAVPINSSEVVLENKVITVSNNTGLTTFYVSLLPGAKLSDLSFEYTVTGGTYDGAMKGIPEKDIQTQATAQGKTKDDFNILAAGKAYAIGNQSWHPYVIIGGKKWATMNVGATAETGSNSYGKYFSWGDTEGQTWNGSAWSNGGFTSAPDIGNPTTLHLENDAAYVNWGGPWRMPADGAAGDIRYLIDTNTNTFVSSSEGGVNGIKITDKATLVKTLFIPCAGYGSATGIHETTYALSWSGTPYNDSEAYHLWIVFSSSGNNATPYSSSRNYGRATGLPIRPVADL